jgi:radical SAM superfamily enzyme YgiQ (UPF0313 family)
MEVVLLSDVYDHGWIRGAGAYRLASELRTNNITTQVVDFVCRLTYEEAVKIFDKFLTQETKVVGISNTFLHKDHNKLFPQDWMLPLIAEYKNKFKFKLVIGGNRLGLTHYEETIDELFDLIVVGFADKVISDIVKDFSNLKTVNFNKTSLLDCKNSEYLYNDFQNSKIEWNKQDCILPGEALPIETARGCIFRCSYCFFPGNGKRYSNDHVKNKEILVEELIKNYENFGITTYDIMDDLLNDSPEKCEFIYDVFTNLPFKLQYVAYARADLLISHPHTLSLLKESGCVSMQFGIETFNKESGKTIGKSMDKEKIINGLNWIKETAPNISIGSGFIIGLPYETKEMIKETVDWLDSKSCPLDNKEIYALSLPRTKNRFEHSKMMINPNEYGYKDLNPLQKDKIPWDNGLINWFEAEALVNEYKTRLDKHNIVNSHQLIRVKNIGIDFKIGMTMPRYELSKTYNTGPNGTLELQKKKEYLEKLLSL